MAKKKRHKDVSRKAGASTAGAVLPAVPASPSRLPAAPAPPSWKQDLYAPISLALLCCVFLYSCIRAARLSITHDEAITYFIQLLNSFTGVMGYTHPLMPNNHFLNTFLVKIFTGLFGPSEFVIRIPALLGAGLYLTAIYRICRVFLRGPRLLLAVGLLTLHPLLLDFFSCARGYALGLGLLAMGLYYLLRRIKEAGSRRDGPNAFGAASLSALAVFAHLTFINIYVAVLCVLAALEVRDAFFSGGPQRPGARGVSVFLKRVFFSMGPGLLFLFAVYLVPGRKILTDSEIRLLASEGFWQKTVRGLIEATAYGKTVFAQGFFFAVLIVLLALAGLSCLALAVRWIRRQPLSVLDRFLLCLAALLLIYSAALVVQHKVLKLTYPCGRWAISYIPLFLLIVVLLAEEARRNTKAFIRLPGTALYYIFASALCLHYVGCLNVTHYHIWKYDASTREMLDIISKLEEDNAPGPFSVHLRDDWLFSPSVNFYVLQKGLWWLNREEKYGPDGRADYYYYAEESEDLIYGKNLELIKKFDVSGAVLARPREKRRRGPVAARDRYDFGGGRSRRDHEKELAEVFLKGFTLNDGPSGYIRRGQYWAQEGKPEAAINDYTKAIEIDPQAYIAYLNRGMVYAQQGDLDKAAADTEEALLIKPFLPEGLDVHGYILYQKKEYAGALRDLNRSVDMDPDRPDTYHHRGLVYAATGEVERALEDFDRTLGLDPSNTKASYDRSLLYLKRGRTQEAVADLTRVIEAEPGNGPAYWHRGRAYEALGDTERAGRDLEKARELGL